jgi:hypothetical protein
MTFVRARCISVLSEANIGFPEAWEILIWLEWENDGSEGSSGLRSQGHFRVPFCASRALGPVQL